MNMLIISNEPGNRLPKKKSSIDKISQHIVKMRCGVYTRNPGSAKVEDNNESYFLPFHTHKVEQRKVKCRAEALTACLGAESAAEGGT